MNLYYMYVWLLTLSVVQSAPPKVPPNRPRIFCSSCSNCFDSPPKHQHLDRNDKLNASYCYTAITMSDDVIIVKRGAVRPDPAKFHDNLDTACPSRTPDFGKMGAVFYCFCADDDCNNVGFNDWGHIQNRYLNALKLANGNDTQAETEGQVEAEESTAEQVTGTPGTELKDTENPAAKLKLANGNDTQAETEGQVEAEESTAEQVTGTPGTELKDTENPAAKS